MIKPSFSALLPTPKIFSSTLNKKSSCNLVPLIALWFFSEITYFLPNNLEQSP